MNIIECEEFLKKTNPDKEIKMEFDEQCYRKQEWIFTDGKPNDFHHLECNKVKATIDGNSIYIPISTHRLTVPHEDMVRIHSAMVNAPK